MRRLAIPFLLCACAHGPSGATDPTKVAAPAAAAPAAPAGPHVVDQGTFSVILAGREIGTETFTVRDGAGGHEISSRTEMRFGQQPVVAEGVLATDGSWRPVSATYKRQAGEAQSELTLARKDDGSLAQKVTSSQGDEREIPETTKSDLYLGEISFSHLTALCALAGDQPKDLSIFPGQPIKVGGRQSLPEALSGKRSLTFIPSIIGGKTAVEVICDGARPAIARYPDFGLTAVRKGYDDVAAALVKAESRKPEIPAGLTELPRQVQSLSSGGATLACSLILPADRSSTLPAVVFVTGSGPEDRDDDSPGAGGMKMALFKHIAIALAQDGVASLRCDDRGVAESTGSIAHATLDTLVDDVAAEVQALRAEPGIDGTRIALVGHAEGGTIAPMVVEKDAAIKALALLAAPGRPLDEIILAQRDDVNRKQGFNDAYVAREHKRMAGIYAAIRAGKPLPASTTEEERRIIEPALDWLASHFRHDPLKSLARLKVPVLVAQGEKDAQTSAKDDAARLRQTLARTNKRGVVKIYPDLSHVFAPVKTGDVADYSDPDLHVDMNFIGDLVTFMKASL